MVELVTGHANKAHATAEQAAGLNAGILGLDDYVLNVHDKFELTVVSANKVTIGTGELVMQGRHVSQGTPEDLIVTNGSQGQKRNDLIVCRYAKGSQSIESAELVVVRGTPTTGTPTDPTLNTTSPLDGGTTYDMPLYRIPLDGITIGTPVPLFNVLRPISDVWDSLTQPKHRNVLKSKTFDGMNVLAVRNLGAVTIWVAQVGSIRTTAEGVVIGTVEDDSRPAVPVRCLFGTNNGVWGIVCVDTGGNITLTHKFNDADVIWSFIDISFSYVIA